jgi:flagellar hook-basal body complex protein FliE
MAVPFAMGAIESIQGMIGVPATILNNTMIGVQQPNQTAVTDRVDFKELLNSAVKSIGESQTNVDDSITKLAAGQNIELHDVMLAAQKADLTLQLALSIKNKVTDAYQSIMSMSI